MRSNRGALCGAGLLAAVVILGGCASTTNGSGRAAPPARHTTSSSPPDFPTAPTAVPPTAPPPTAVPPTAAPATAAPPTTQTQPNSPSDTSTATSYPAPPTPYRTVTVCSSGTAYVVKIWFDIKNRTCADHAYGQPIIGFLTRHPCIGLERYLATTTVNGGPVGLALSDTGFAGTRRNLYGEAGRFAHLEQQNGKAASTICCARGTGCPAGRRPSRPGRHSTC